MNLQHARLIVALLALLGAIYAVMPSPTFARADRRRDCVSPTTRFYGIYIVASDGTWDCVEANFWIEMN